MLPLNFDVITIIIAHLDDREALRICTLCKAIYAFVIARVLSVVPVLPNKHTEGLANSADFILADPTTRLPRVRRFLLTVFHWFDHNTCRPAEIAEDRKRLHKSVMLLVQVLLHGRRLHTLEIGRVSLVFSQYPHLRDALKGYKDLHELCLGC